MMMMQQLRRVSPLCAAAQRLAAACQSAIQAAAGRVVAPTASSSSPVDAAGCSRGGSSSSSSSSISSRTPGCRTAHSATSSTPRAVVAVAMSGGVDSAVAALLLQQQGHEVFGVHMHTWDAGDEAGAGQRVCTAEQDLADAQAVADQLRIPLLQLDVVSRYWTLVFEGYLEGLARGLTPNPDLACNNAIKFGVLMDFARQQGADVLATGHYARLRGGWLQQRQQPQQQEERDPRQERAPAVQLLRAADADKDQTYFLAGLTAAQLERAAFPVGGLTKPQVRAIAAEAGLAPKDKRSSAGICFVGRRDFGGFLESYLAAHQGTFVDVDTQRTLGTCHNMLAVTHGQRAGVPGLPAPYFVAGKQLAERLVWVAKGHDHPALFSRRALLGPPSWIAGAPPAALRLQERGGGGGSSGSGSGSNSDAAGGLQCHGKARYRQLAAPCSVHAGAGAVGFAPSRLCSPPARPTSAAATRPGGEEGWLVVELRDAQRGITPGQAFVMYEEEVCLGGAPVLAPGCTEWEASMP